MLFSVRMRGADFAAFSPIQLFSKVGVAFSDTYPCTGDMEVSRKGTEPDVATAGCPSRI